MTLVRCSAIWPTRWWRKPSSDRSSRVAMIRCVVDAPMTNKWASAEAVCKQGDMLGNFLPPPQPPMKSLALGAIRFYQRFLSPRKGFCCAYAAASGRGSCSALGYRAIRRYGVWRGIAVLDKRLDKCGVAYRRHHGVRSRQAGFLDCACDVPAGCDLSGCDMPHSCSKLMSCGDLLNFCDCDWRRQKKQRRSDGNTR